MNSKKGDDFLTQSILLKAFGHKYIRKVPKRAGKGYWYVYKETFKKPLQALARIFGVEQSRIDADYGKYEIEKNYGADKTTYAAHVLEYFTNKEKWDGIFSKEENRKKYSSPKKPKARTGEKRKPSGGNKGRKTERKPTDDAIRVNRSLMYKVWSVYGSGREAQVPSEERSRAMMGNQNARKDGAGKDIEEQRKDALSALKNNAVEMMSVEYSRDTYNKLFPRGKINTVIGAVKMGEHQFERLANKDGGARASLLGAMYQTLKDPCVVFVDTDAQGRDANLFAKTFADGDKRKTTIAVVVDINGNLVSVSFGERQEKGIERKIKMARQFRYIAEVADPTNGTARAAGVAHSDANEGSRSSSSTTLPQSEKPVNRENAGSKAQTDAEMRREKKETEKARKEAGLPPVREDLGARVSAIDDLSWNPNDENYRYKDTGYIAGSRKEKALLQIRQAGKNRERLRETDIDWEAIEENGRAAKEVITKSNIFGQVDWAALKEGGMTGGAAFLIDRVYAAIGKEPAEDSAEARRSYVIGVNGLRDRLEEAKTVDDVNDALREIYEEMHGRFLSVRESPEAEERYAPVREIGNKRAEADKKASAKFNEMEKERAYANTRAAERIKAFLRENKAIKGNQRVSRDIEHYKDALSAEKWIELHALKERAEEEEQVKANELLKEYQKLRADYEAISERADKERKKYQAWIAEKEARAALSNPLSKAWKQLGSNFIAVASVYGNKTFARHMADARRGNYDDWKWAEKEKIEVPRKGEKRKARFEFFVARSYRRKGGRNVSVKSTEELKKAFNLRDIQSGNWVLNDPESAKWHVDRCAEGFADLCDVTGIPDSLISLNGRLALAIGARGNGGSALAHYEPVERVINITKMKGGGSLAHEWFHAFDNMIMEAMGGYAGGKNSFMTNKYHGFSKMQRVFLDRYLNAQSGWQKEQYKKRCEAIGVKIPETPTEEHQIKVAAAFDELTRAMTEGTVPQYEPLTYSENDARAAKYNIYEGRAGLGGRVYDAGSFEKAAEVINEQFKDAQGNSKREKLRNIWLRAAAAHYHGAPKEGEKNTVQVAAGAGTSAFLNAAKKLDGENSKAYWATPHEMAARAFSAYIDDKLRGQGRLNDYLANNTSNSVYGESQPYPVGEERERINAAFDKLFKTVAETKAIRKALDAIARRNRWIWIGKDGKVWIRKSALEAWERGMAK